MQPLTDDDPVRVGNYTLLGRLGSGAMGTVYLGRSRSGRYVAVKLVSSGLTEEHSFRDRFRHEVANMRKVGGFWTAGVVDADPDAPRPWVATEYIAGPTLAEYVREKGPLPESELFGLGAALAEALVSVHGAGVVHRDLKPGNILISTDGPRVIDFGISRVLDQTTLTATGVAIGTPGFMSPEQVEAGEVGPASDVFSLAGVLVFAATGNGPFGAGSLPSILYAVAHGEPRLDGVPPRLRAVLEPCFAKDPAARPTAAQLLDSFTPDRDPVTMPVATSAGAPPPPSVSPGAVAATDEPPTRPVAPPAPTTPARGEKNDQPLPIEFILGSTLAGIAGYLCAFLLNGAIEAPVPQDRLRLTEFVPVVLTSLIVFFRPFRTERARFWGSFVLGFGFPAVLTAWWVPYDNLLSPTDTMYVFTGHALPPLALLTIADIAIGRRTTGEPLGGVPQFALPVAIWVIDLYFQAYVVTVFLGVILLLIFPALVAVLLFGLLASPSGRRRLDRSGLVISLGISALPAVLYLLQTITYDVPLHIPLANSLLATLPTATFAIPFVLVRRSTVRRAARRARARMQAQRLPR
ncbi:serine/threonine-protein kinase [Saccharomonospora glauca]|uniref:Serine/threonine protein kinase n=1 Tax=Saccharomonospora glauca K62 TaxID=928724 RepID=I1D3L5_9PSEU|nr:serine/threonine-protein kinase [Saccharomonospora glauca]EIE99539.1 serine/threonine protein kinase [Saccharomonospora glauca K62]